MNDFRLASTESWTDDLPTCGQTGVGTQTNQIYRRNGSRHEFHSCEDKSFHFCLNSNTYFYGLFDGHKGTNAANFVTQHLPAEVLLGQLIDATTDEDVRQVFAQAFNSVEREYFQSIDNSLAEKTLLELQIQGMSGMEAFQTFPEIVERLKTVTAEVSSGTTAVVALIHVNRLHVANVGDSKAILCKTDPFGSYTAVQLSTDHDLLNDDELTRLSALGLDINVLKQRQKIGNVSITRCIGNHVVKGAYQESTDLCAAKDEPVIAEPSIYSVPIDDSTQFLILASGSLFRTLEASTGTRQVNSDIVRMVAEEFQIQSTLTGVAQAVINKICRIHQDQYLAAMDDPTLPKSAKEIEDLTLMVRNFNHSLVKCMSSPNSRSSSMTSMQRRFDDQLRISINEEDEELADNGLEGLRGRSFSRTLITGHLTVNEEVIETIENTETTTTTDSSTEFEDRRFDSQRADPLVMDEEGKIEPYVQFDELFLSLEKAKSDGNFSDFVISDSDSNVQ